MKTTHDLPPFQYIIECFNYDPNSGDLTWKHRPSSHFKGTKGWNKFNSQFAGTTAGSKRYGPDGSRRGIRIGLCVHGESWRFYAHRIIFQLMGVNIPQGFDIDHKDLDTFNNRWINLRLATYSQNGTNKRRCEARSYPLPKGVYKPSGGSFCAQIQFNNQHYHLGSFPTPELAHAAYCAKAAELQGEFARFN